MDYFKKLIKRIIFCLIFSFIILSIKHYVFGAFVFENEGTTYSFPNLPNTIQEYYLFTYDSNRDSTQDPNTYMLYTSSNPFTLSKSGSSWRLDNTCVNCYVYYNYQNYANYSNRYVLKDHYTSGSLFHFGFYNNSSVTYKDVGKYNILYTNHDIYYGNNLAKGDSTFIEPFIVNDTTDIENWSFDYLAINLGSINYTANKDVLSINYNDNIFLIDLDLYDIEDNIIYIPKQDLNNRIVFTESFSISFEYDSFATTPFTAYNIGSYQITLSTYDVNELNDNADRNIQIQIMEQNQQIYEQQNRTNDLLNDDNIDDYSSDLPSTDVSNPTESGLDNIFQSFYNAFCTGTAQDIVFPIPFTNKNITLSPYYIRDMLNNNNASWVYTFIQAFWGYLIGRYIVKDISRKIDKIKSGDIENIENDNIKEEML